MLEGFFLPFRWTTIFPSVLIRIIIVLEPVHKSLTVLNVEKFLSPCMLFYWRWNVYSSVFFLFNKVQWIKVENIIKKFII